MDYKINNLHSYIDAINKYFGTNYKYDFTIPEFGLNKENKFIHELNLFNLNELMRFVFRIQEKGYLFNIQDLNNFNKSPEYRIWFNKIIDGEQIECGYGQISSSSVTNYLQGNTLEYCLLYSIGEWCKYSQYEIEWVRIRNQRNPQIKYNGYITVNDKKHLIYRIHDLDYFNLEYIDYTGLIIMSEFTDNILSDVVKIATYCFYNRTSIINDIDKYTLDN